MNKSKYRVLYLYLAALIVLFMISFFRKKTVNSSSVVRNGIFFGTYLLLTLIWMFSMRSRISQLHIRRFLCVEGVFMCFGILIRFIQESFLQDNLYLLRFSGLLVCATALPILIAGFYSSLGLGEGENYTLPRQWNLLLIPVIIIEVLQLTDMQHHIVFCLLPDEIYPNIVFHPYIGFWATIGMGTFILGARIVNICQKSGILREKISEKTFLATAELPLTLIFIFPYAVSSFYHTPEIVEFLAGLYYLEALGWELYILAGLIPVNTHYQQVFEQSTLGMRIIDQGGTTILRSGCSMDLTDDMINQLRTGGKLISDNIQMCIHEEKEYGVIWQSDIGDIQHIVRELEAAASELQQENQILEEEYRARSREIRISAQNKIYSALSGECASQLQLMEKLVDKCRNRSDNKERYKMLLVLGTYVKRRCQLRLNAYESGILNLEDVRLAYSDMMTAIQCTGTQTEINWEAGNGPASNADYWIRGFDLIENVLEENEFQADNVALRVLPETIDIRVSGAAGIHCRTERSGKYEKLVQRDSDGIRYTMRG